MRDVARRFAGINLLASSSTTAVIRISGELDHESERRWFRAAFGVCIQTDHRYAALDCAALSFCDSHRLNCLLGLQWLPARLDGAPTGRTRFTPYPRPGSDRQ